MKSSNSLDELDNVSFGSNPGVTNMSFATERFEKFLVSKQAANVEALFSGHTPPPMEAGDDDWEVLTKKIDSRVRMGVEFFEYPKNIFNHDQVTNQGQVLSVDGCESPGDSKVFLGGMRFELVQMGKQAVAWLLEVACKVNVNPSRILIHRRARNGRLAPTGCASIFITSDTDSSALLTMNQRIFCGVRGLFVAQTPEQMAQLILGKSILDIVDGRVRGPTHPIVIEKAYSSQTPSSNNSFAGAGSLSPPTNASFNHPNAANRPPPPDPATAQYHRFQGFENNTVQEALQIPTELFVGGLCYEASQPFVAWMFSLMGVSLHPNNVTLYVDPSTGVKRGCAQIKIDESDFEKAMVYNRRILCDTHGIYLAENPQGIHMLQNSRDKHLVKGPTHPVVIERRRNARGSRQSPYQQNQGQQQHPQAQQQQQLQGQGLRGPSPPQYGEQQWMSGSFGAIPQGMNPSFPPMIPPPMAMGGMTPPLNNGSMVSNGPRQIPTPPMFQQAADPPPPSYTKVEPK